MVGMRGKETGEKIEGDAFRMEARGGEEERTRRKGVEVRGRGL